MSDVLLSIGISTDEAKRGHDQIIAYNNDIAASFRLVTDASAKVWSNVQSGAVPTTQSIHKVIEATTGLGSGFKSAADSADVFKQKMVSAAKEAEAAYDTYAANRMRDMARISAAQEEQNRKSMLGDQAAQRLLGINQSGGSAKSSASVFEEYYQSQEKAKKVHDAATTAMMEGELQRAQAAQKAAASLSSLDARLGLISQSTRTYNIAQAELNNLLKAGVITADQYTQRQSMVKAASEAGTLALDHHGRAIIVANENHHRLTNSIGLTAHGMRNLSYQINDVVSGLAMGQPPMMILTQQGGQFVQVAQEMGLSLGRIAVGIGVVAAAGTALIGPTIHLANMRLEAKELDIALKAVGNSASLSGQKIQDFAYRTAASSMSSRADVTAAFKGISTSAVGRDLGPQQIEALTKAAEGYAFVTGKTLPEATNDLMKVLAGGYIEMNKLAQLYPMATERELDQLRVMAQHGDRAGMLAKSIELLNGKFGTLAKEGAGELKTAMHSLTTAWDEMIDKISRGQAYKDFLTMLSSSSRGIATILREGFGSSSGYKAGEGDAEAVAAFDAYRKKQVSKVTYGEQFGPEFNDPKKELDRQAAIKATSSAILEAAQKQAAAYNLIGLARERALVSVEYDKKIAEAQGDASKAAQLLAEKRAALIMVDAQAIGQAKENISSLQEEAKAQMRLADAAGKGYTAQMLAERQNKIAAAQRTNPFANAGGAMGRAIDEAQENARLKAQREYINGLADSAENENKLTDAKIKGIEATRLETDAIEARTKSKYSGYSVDEIQKALNDASLAKQRADITNKAISSSATLAARQSAQETELVIQRMKELGATAEEIADVYIDAEARRLEATRDWADGATAALMRYSRSASNYGQQAGQIVTNSFASMENALVGFTSGTKKASDAFKEMATSIIQDLIRMQVRASITGPLSGMLSGIVSSGFGNIGTAFQYGTNIGSEQTAMLAAQNAGFNAYASGTDYAQSGLAIVGEEGPELMQLGGGERIYPAGETAAILSGRAANSNMGGGGNFSIAEGAIVVNAPGATAEDAAIIAQQVATAVVQQAAQQIVKASVQQSLSASKSAADRGGSFAQAMGRR